MSSEDKRFSEFLKCFSILFGVTVEQLMDEYNSVLKMVQIKNDVFKTKEYVSLGTDFDYHEFNWLSFNRNR